MTLMTGFVLQGHIYWFAAQETCLIIINIVFFLQKRVIHLQMKIFWRMQTPLTFIMCTKDENHTGLERH